MSPRPPAEDDAILAVAVEAARAAGALLSEAFGHLSPTIGRKSSQRDLVTEADVASERLLVERLRRAFPDHRIEAEEEVHDPRSAEEPARWFLDPLDGTVNFVHGLPLWCVSMGLWRGGEPQLAVVHAPLLGETFTAVRGRGAHCNGAPLRVSAAPSLGEAVLGTGFPYRRNELVPSNLENVQEVFFDVRGLRRMGSAALDLAFTAAGRLDGFWELWLAPHDVAAGGLLVREAGGLVTDLAGGDDWLRGQSILAAGRAVHGALLGRLRGPAAPDA